MLTLSRAIRTGQLRKFIVQEEARGISPADRQKLDSAIAQAIKAPRSKRQTSRSQGRAGSPGK